VREKVILLISFSLTIFSCKKECIPDVPEDKHLSFVIDSASKCIPTFHLLTDSELSFIDYINDTIFPYIDDNNAPYNFSFAGNYRDTVGNCNYQYEYYISNFYSSAFNWLIIYDLHSSYNLPDNFLIHIGPSGQLGCESIFKISTENDLPDLDSLELLGKTYYNVYYRTVNPAFCATEMYYNKQYGVVGFNWLGEWYVLETDSL
jgi:hypothetical protein